MGPSIPRWQCPMHNGNIKRFFFIKFGLDFNGHNFETNPFQFEFLYLNDLCISTAGKYIGIFGIKHV